MYCPSCGTALSQELSYCNRCGADLRLIKGDATAQSLEKSIESIIWAIVAVTATVLGIMVAVMGLMKGFDLSATVVVWVMGLMLLTLLGIDGVFVWQLLRLNARAKEARRASLSRELETQRLGSANEQALPAAGISITEQTTRTLEPSYEERRVK